MLRICEKTAYHKRIVVSQNIAALSAEDKRLYEYIRESSASKSNGDAYNADNILSGRYEFS